MPEYITYKGRVLTHERLEGLDADVLLDIAHDLFDAVCRSTEAKDELATYAGWCE